MDFAKIAKSTQEIKSMDKAELADLIAKYSIMAEAYVTSSGKNIILNNRPTFEKTLAFSVVNTFTMLNMNNGIPNASKELRAFLDPNSDKYVANLVKELNTDNGWNIPDYISVSDIVEALSMFNVEEVSVLPDGAERIEEVAKQETDQSILNKLFNQEQEDAELAKYLNGEEDEEDEEKLKEKNEDAELAKYLNGEDEEEEHQEEEHQEEEHQEQEQKKEEHREKTQEEKEEEERIEAEINRYKEAAAKYGLTAEDLDGLSDEDVAKKIMELDEKIAKEVERTKKLQESEEASKIIKEEADKSNVDKVILTKTINSIMAIYDIIYQPLFQITPKGVLTSAGIVSIKSDNSLYVVGEGKAYAIRVYKSIVEDTHNVISELDYHEEVSSSKCLTEDGQLICNYIPNWHARNIYGIYRGKDGTLQREKVWGKFRPKLIKALTTSITNLLSHCVDDDAQIRLSRSLIKLFTTVFVAEEFDVDKSVKITSKSMDIRDCSIVGKILTSDVLGLDTSTIKLIDNSDIGSGVYSTLAIFNEKMYNGEILFAYKPLEKILGSGGQVNLENLLMGRNLRGRNVTINFKSPQLIDTLVLAGSGSGKGVVTLNMLATFVASGCPTVYVDWKPDMAAMLWDLERETGAKILAIDGLAGKTDYAVPPRNYGVGFNKPDVPYNAKLNTLSYLKAFQCMVLCAQARNQGYAGLSSKQPKMMFIFDEAQLFNVEYRELRKSVEAYLDDKDVKAENKKEKTPAYLYTKRLKNMLSDLYNGAVEVRNTTGRTGNLGFVMLGQQADVSAWSDGALKKGEPFGFLVGNCSMKLLGKDACDTNKYSLNGAKPAGSDLLGNMGYFAVVKQAIADAKAPEKIDVLKTYLVLNKNDYEDDGAGGSTGKFTGGMLSNVTDLTLKDQLINEDFYPEDENGNKYINQKVGFKGLIEYMGSTIAGFDLNKNLSAGYESVDAVLSELGITGPNGKYSCVEEYLFDCSYDSLFSLFELKKLITEGKTIADLAVESDQGGSEDDKGVFNKEAPDESFATLSDDEEEEKKQEPPKQVGATTGTGTNNIPQSGTSDIKLTPQAQREIAEIARRKAALKRQEEEKKQEQTQTGGTQTGETQTEETQTGGTQTGGQQDIDEHALDGEDIAYNGSGNTGYDQASHQAMPDVMPNNTHQTARFGGPSGRDLYLTPERSANVLGLTDRNSIKVVMPSYDTTNRFSKRLFKTMWGVEYEFKNRWKVLLKSVASKINPNMITRINIMEDGIFFNNRMCATLGLLGGEEDIRVEDIVNFKMTAKQFPMTSMLIMDTVIFERAQIELGEPDTGLFQIFPRLQQIMVMDVGSDNPVYGATRSEYEQGIRDQKMQRAVEKAKYKNQFGVMTSAKDPHLREKSPGQRRKVWQSACSMTGNNWGAAKNALMEKDPKLFRAATLGISGAIIIGGGAILGAGSWLFDKIRGR